MTNPAFDAALLLRGLRAMDAALGETYNVQNHMCTPSPVVYEATFPEKGIDFQQYQGITGVKNSWRGWMYEDSGNGKLKTNVHEDVEATVVEAFGILERCDKSKEGLLTQDEWISCQNGKSAEDQLFDLEYLLALNSVTGKMLTLEKDKPLNPADPNTYPELIQSRGEFAAFKTAKEGEIKSLTSELDRSRDDVSFYQTLTVTFGGLVGVFGVLALVFGMRSASKSKSILGMFQANKKLEGELNRANQEVERLSRSAPQNLVTTQEIRPGRPRVNLDAPANPPPTNDGSRTEGNSYADIVNTLSSEGLIYDAAQLPAEMKFDLSVVERQIAFLSPEQWMTPNQEEIKNDSRESLKQWAEYAVEEFKATYPNINQAEWVTLWDQEIQIRRPAVTNGIPFTELTKILLKGVDSASIPNEKAKYESHLARADGTKPSSFEARWVELAKKIGR